MLQTKDAADQLHLFCKINAIITKNNSERDCIFIVFCV